MYRLRRPVAETVVVDMVGTLRRATKVAWELVTLYMELLRRGPGSGRGRLLSSRTGSLARTTEDSRTLPHALPRTEVDTVAEAAAIMTTNPPVLPMEGGYNGTDRFVGAVQGLGMGMSNRAAVRSVLEDSSSTMRAHSSPLPPIFFVGTRSIASLALLAAMVRLGVVWVRNLVASLGLLERR
jgi:hypothetical protein